LVTEAPSIEMTGKSLIAGEWIEGQDEAFESYHPASGQVVGRLRGCGPGEVERALESACEAYRAYRVMAPSRIAAFLRAIAEQIEALGDPLLETGDAETSLGLKRMTGERARTCGQIRAFADLVNKAQWLDARIDTADADAQPPKPDLRRMRRPLGPVVVFGASNFPFAFGTVGGDTASALAAGNPVVVKGHPSHPATNELFARSVRNAIEQTDMPRGVFSMLQGTSAKLSRALVEHPATEAVGFTGSQKVGRLLHDLAAARSRPIPVFAEMGSINPLFVLPAAMKARHGAIAENLAGSVTLGVGQFCTQPGVIITLESDENDRFIDELKAGLGNAATGPLLNTGIAQALAADVAEFCNRDDVQCLLGGKPVDGQPSQFQNTLLKTDARAFNQHPRLREEVFGPVTMIVECRNTDEMVQVAQSLEGQLTATLQFDQEDEELADRLTSLLEDRAGRLICNGVPTGVAVCPSMQHGGPYPASTAAATTSVGTAAIERFTRFVSYQNYPQSLLPMALKDDNPLGIVRMVDGETTDAQLGSTA
jgi:NADP-dependent aldehyde dehydrogenase